MMWWRQKCMNWQRECHEITNRVKINLMKEDNWDWWWYHRDGRVEVARKAENETRRNGSWKDEISITVLRTARNQCTQSWDGGVTWHHCHRVEFIRIRNESWEDKGECSTARVQERLKCTELKEWSLGWQFGWHGEETNGEELERNTVDGNNEWDKWL